jgi:hypothetical protein
VPSIFGIAPHFVIADRDEPAAVEPGRAHLFVGRRQQLQHRVGDALPVRALLDAPALIAPPDDVTAIDYEPGAPSLHVTHDFARHPVAALQHEDLPVHAWQQFHVLDGGAGDPALVHRQGHDFAPRHERHHDLDQGLADRIEGQPDVALDHLLRHPLRQDEAEYFDEHPDQVRIALPVGQIHHRPRIAAAREREPTRGRLRFSRGRQ